MRQSREDGVLSYFILVNCVGGLNEIVFYSSLFYFILFSLC